MKILVLTSFYDVFVKGSVDATAKYVEAINILIRHNYLAEISNYLPLGGYLQNVRRYTKDKLLDLKGKPENVNVHLASLIYLVPDGKNKSLGYKIAKKAEKFIKKMGINFDLIHAHFIYPYGYVGIKLGEEFDVPVVITAHGFDVYDLPFRDKEWEEKIRWILNQANHIITVSQSNKKILVEKLGVKENKLSVIPNGFDLNLFYPMDRTKVKGKLNLPLDKKMVLNVANLYQVKGQRYLIEAMKELIKYRKDILCIIVGDGILSKDLKAQIKKLGLENYVKLVGRKPHDEIPLWMNAADLFVLPSLRESFGVVQIEAMACGKPVIATKNGGSEEIVVSEDYGLLCEPGNSKLLAEKIIIGLDKEWDTKKILKYVTRFTWDNAAKEITEVYNELLI